MTTRELPPAEWPKLAGTELEQVWPLLSPDQAVILVVEDGDHIIGCWAALRYVHLEGVWIHPDHRKRSGVARRLLGGMRRTLAGSGVTKALTGAMSDDVRGLLGHLGAQRLPGDHYVVSFGG